MQRWVVVDAVGRERIVYTAMLIDAASLVGGIQEARLAGHWNYDRCEVIGALDLGNVEVGQ